MDDETAQRTTDTITLDDGNVDGYQITYFVGSASASDGRTPTENMRIELHELNVQISNMYTIIRSWHRNSQEQGPTF